MDGSLPLDQGVRGCHSRKRPTMCTVSGSAKDELITSLAWQRLQQFDHWGRQRHAMLATAFDAFGRNGPGLGTKVDLVPARANRLAGCVRHRG